MADIERIKALASALEEALTGADCIAHSLLDAAGDSLDGSDRHWVHLPLQIVTMIEGPALRLVEAINGHPRQAE